MLQEVLSEDFCLWSFTDTNDDQDFFEVYSPDGCLSGLQSQAQIT